MSRGVSLLWPTDERAIDYAEWVWGDGVWRVEWAHWADDQNSAGSIPISYSRLHCAIFKQKNLFFAWKWFFLSVRNQLFSNESWLTVRSIWESTQRPDKTAIPFENMKMCTKTSLLRWNSIGASASVRRQRNLVHFRGERREKGN